LILRPLLQLDLFLNNRVFMPLAHWIDWRFHRSPYQQAWVLVVVAQAMNIGVSIWVSLQSHWAAPFLLGSAVLLHFAFRNWRRMLVKAQKQFETRPDNLCVEQCIFMSPYMVPARLLMLIGGAMIVAMLGAMNITLHHWPDPGTYLNSWMVVIAVALYVAGSFPPLRPRREKKAWAWPVHATQATPA
jgi:hypothetical protein